MVLEKFALLKVGTADELKFLEQYCKDPPPANYKRAWEMVNDIEGHESFFRELKPLRK